MVDAGWAGAIAHKINLPHPLRSHSQPDGRIKVELECSTCPKVTDWYIRRRYPPEAFARKLREMGWDLRKRRCPACVVANRKTKRHNHNESPLPPRGGLQLEIQRVFGDGVKPEPLPQIGIGEHMDTKIGINDRNVSVLVPVDSKFIDAFMNKENFKAKDFWSIDLVQESAQGEPLVRVSRVKMPPGKQRAPGIAQGSYNSATGMFTITMARGSVGGSGALGEFRTTEARFVKQDDNSFYFRLPKNRKPPVLRGQYKEEPKSKDKPASGVSAMKTVVEARAPRSEPQAQAAPVAEPRSVEPPAPVKVSIRQAVDIINKHKDNHGDEMVMVVTTAGHLKVMLEYGPDD